MSIRNTEVQKARRRYLDKCRKDGATPISAEAFAKMYASKEARRARRAAAKAADVPKTEEPKEAESASGKSVTHEIHVGDSIEFINFSPMRALSLALSLVEAAHSAIHDERKFVGDLFAVDAKTGDKAVVKCVRVVSKRK